MTAEDTSEVIAGAAADYETFSVNLQIPIGPLGASDAATDESDSGVTGRFSREMIRFLHRREVCFGDNKVRGGT